MFPTLWRNICNRARRPLVHEDGGEAVCSLWKKEVSGLSRLQVLRLHSCYFTELFSVSPWALHLAPADGDHLGTWFAKEKMTMCVTTQWSAPTLKPQRAEVNWVNCCAYSSVFCWWTLDPDVHVDVTWHKPSTSNTPSTSPTGPAHPS